MRLKLSLSRCPLRSFEALVKGALFLRERIFFQDATQPTSRQHNRCVRQYSILKNEMIMSDGNNLFINKIDDRKGKMSHCWTNFDRRDCRGGNSPELSVKKFAKF